MPGRQTLIYHITAIDNLAGIIEEGGLWAKSRQVGRDVTYQTIAHESIQDKRATRQVRRGPRGVLHDYVPFYFAPRSPMLSAIHHGKVAGYSGGQRRVVYLVSSVESVADNGVPFVFTDGHAVIELSQTFESVRDLDRIDWPLMRAKYWSDTIQDNDRKRRRQAEFLIYEFCPWSALLGLAAYGNTEAEEVEEIIRGSDPALGVGTRPQFYY